VLDIEVENKDFHKKILPQSFFISCLFLSPAVSV